MAPADTKMVPKYKGLITSVIYIIPYICHLVTFNLKKDVVLKELHLFHT